MVELVKGTLLGFCVVVLSFIVFPLCLEYTKRGKMKPKIRRLPALEAIEEALGRATEMRRPVMFFPRGSLTATNTLAALAILGHAGRRAARLGTELIVPVTNPMVQLSAWDILKGVYMTEGKSEDYEAKVRDNVMFLSTSQFGSTSAILGIMERRKIVANMLFGGFGDEALILAEAGNRTGAIQIAGTDSTSTLTVFVAACDYVLIGEELYAAGAYLSEDPVALGTLQGQDYFRIGILLFLIAGIISVTMGIKSLSDLTRL